MLLTNTEPPGGRLNGVDHSKRTLVQDRARRLGFAFVDIDRIQIAQEVVDLMWGDFTHRHCVLPIKKTNDTLYLVMADPADQEAILAASAETNCLIVPVLALRAEIERALHRYYPRTKTEG